MIEIIVRYNWVRLSGRGHKYHYKAENWPASGKAICGAAIARPAYEARSLPGLALVGRRACKHCLTARAKVS